MPPRRKFWGKNKQFWENNNEKIRILYAAGGENFEEKIIRILIFSKIIRVFEIFSKIIRDFLKFTL